jgi:hypothetical protein
MSHLKYQLKQNSTDTIHIHTNRSGAPDHRHKRGKYDLYRSIYGLHMYKPVFTYDSALGLVPGLAPHTVKNVLYEKITPGLKGQYTDKNLNQ